MSNEVNEQLIEKVYHETLEMSVDAFADELMKLGYTYVLNDLIKKVAQTSMKTYRRRLSK